MKKRLIFLFIGLFVLSCTDESSNTGPILDVINEFHQKWESANIANYSFVQQRDCYCVEAGIYVTILVKNKVITNVGDSLGTDVPPELWQKYKSVNQLYDLLYTITQQKVSQLLFDFDSTYSYPNYIYVDPNSMVLNDEYLITSRSFIPK